MLSYHKELLHLFLNSAPSLPEQTLGSHSHWKKTFLVNFCIDVFATQKQAFKKSLPLRRPTHTYDITNRGNDTGYLFSTMNTIQHVSLRLEALLSSFLLH